MSILCGFYLLVSFSFLPTKHLQEHKNNELYIVLFTLPALWQHSMRVYRALALNAEVITGVACNPLYVISASTQKNINYHSTQIKQHTTDPYLTDSLFQTSSGLMLEDYESPVSWMCTGTYLHVILLPCTSHLPVPQYSQLFSSHCGPKYDSEHWQCLVPFIISIQVPPFLQKSSQWPAMISSTYLTLLHLLVRRLLRC